MDFNPDITSIFTLENEFRVDFLGLSIQIMQIIHVYFTSDGNSALNIQ